MEKLARDEDQIRVLLPAHQALVRVRKYFGIVSRNFGPETPIT